MAEKVVVLGAGESGIGSALLAKKQGFDVFVSELKPLASSLCERFDNEGIQWETGQHSVDQMLGATWIVKSPGIPSTTPVIQKLLETGHTLVSEIEFAARYTTAKLIAITGTNGKTTTTLLTYKIIKDAGFNVGLAGNIGTSFALQVATEHYDYYVLEISSFQLDDIRKFAPHIAVITNITPDHLDRYQYSFEAYIKAKLKIQENQKAEDYFLYNSDDEVLEKAVSNTPIQAAKIPFGFSPQSGGTTFISPHIQIQHQHQNTMINSAQFPLYGRHNLLNAMAAATVGSLLQISKDSIRESLIHFKGAPHRMEKVLTIQKVEYINDSKATNVNATYFALESIDNPLVWIVGGVDKGNDYTPLLPLIRKKAKAIICLGVDNKKLRDIFEGMTEVFIETQSITEAVKIAHKVAVPKDTVLLSPACASFDLFKNYEDRGDQFKAAVRNL